MFSVLAFLLLNLGVVSVCGADRNPRLPGVWFGDGIHPMSRTVLIVDGDQFTIVSPLGAFTVEVRFKTTAATERD
jgi:hypothetical protein